MSQSKQSNREFIAYTGKSGKEMHMIEYRVQLAELGKGRSLTPSEKDEIRQEVIALDIPEGMYKISTETVDVPAIIEYFMDYIEIDGKPLTDAQRKNFRETYADMEKSPNKYVLGKRRR